MTGQAGLRRFAVPPDPAPAPALPAAGQAGTPDQEKCEVCAATLVPQHGHVADLENSALLCACRPCYLLFTSGGAGGNRFRAVPDRYLCDAARPLTRGEWGDLQVPVSLAFFLDSTRAGRVCAFYPSPAGATECLLDLGMWDRLRQAHPLLKAAAPDVEAVLISGGGPGARSGAGGAAEIECFLVPIDVCYELTGRLRMLWQGFDGGQEAREAIAQFLGMVRGRAQDLAEES